MRWSVEQVEAAAPSPAAVTAAQPLATPSRWSGLGADERAVWGACRGSGAEPYDTVVDHETVAFRCTCPSRKVPCKHAIALLLLWVRGQVPAGVASPAVERWLDGRRARGSTRSGDDGRGGPGHDRGDGAGGDGAGGDGAGGDGAGAAGDEGAGDDVAPPPDDADRDRARDERVERMLAGLDELDRWLEDRMRTGLADPALARYATWDELAARLVDARAGSLANRVRRIAGLVGASADWQDDVLAELGLLHLLARAGRRIADLPGGLGDAVATTIGWQVKRADVLAGVPDSDRWIVAGRSDTREDRIEVRRHWLYGERSGRWALALGFAAYQQSLDDSLEVGSAFDADLHRYPGPALRALVGRRHSEPERPAAPPAVTVAAACDSVGRLLVAEPWLDRVPVTLRAAPTRRRSGWVLGDDTGSLDLLPRADDGTATLLAVSGGRPVDLTVEWTPHGVLPLSIHLHDRVVDIGPVADPSFVGAA